MLETTLVGPGLRVVAEADGEALPDELAERVDTLWSAARAEFGDTLYDGRFLSLTRRKGDTLYGRFLPYRFAVAQRRDPALMGELGVRPLAVTGLLMVDEGYVFGLRGAGVAINRGLWELAPSGSIDPECRQPDGTVDILHQLRGEAEEELNVPAPALRGLRPFALVYNTETGITEVGIAGRIACDAAALRRVFAERRNREYEAMAVVPDAAADAFDGDGLGRGVDPVSHALLAAHRGPSRDCRAAIGGRAGT